MIHKIQEIVFQGFATDRQPTSTTDDCTDFFVHLGEKQQNSSYQEQVVVQRLSCSRVQMLCLAPPLLPALLHQHRIQQCLCPLLPYNHKIHACIFFFSFSFLSLLACHPSPDPLCSATAVFMFLRTMQRSILSAMCTMAMHHSPCYLLAMT